MALIFAYHPTACQGQYRQPAAVKPADGLSGEHQVEKSGEKHEQEYERGEI